MATPTSDQVIEALYQAVRDMVRNRPEALDAMIDLHSLGFINTSQMNELANRALDGLRRSERTTVADFAVLEHQSLYDVYELICIRIGVQPMDPSELPVESIDA